MNPASIADTLPLALRLLTYISSSRSLLSVFLFVIFFLILIFILSIYIILPHFLYFSFSSSSSVLFFFPISFFIILPLFLYFSFSFSLLLSVSLPPFFPCPLCLSCSHCLSFTFSLAPSVSLPHFVFTDSVNRPLHLSESSSYSTYCMVSLIGTAVEVIRIQSGALFSP